MRKILLGTTAVVGAALLAPGAFAQAPAGRQVPAGGGAPTAGTGSLAPQAGGTQGATLTAAPSPSLAGAGGLTVRLGGYFAFTGAVIQDDNDRANRIGANNTAARSRYDFRNDAELTVFIDGRAANGMTYGAVIEFQMDNGTGTAGDNSNVSIDEMFGFIALPNLGRIYFGAEDGAANLLQIRAPASAALGGDGDWTNFIVETGLFGGPYQTSGISDGSDATKIGYLSPQFAGFDFGISYAANGGEGERADLANGVPQRNRTTRENEIQAGLRYRGTFGPVGVSFGVGGLWANAPQNITNTTLARGQDLTAYFFGAQVAAYGFAFGAEYGFGQYNGASMGLGVLNRGIDDSWHYLVGATYTMGPVVFGAIFGQSEQDNGSARVGGVITDLDDRKHTVWGVGVGYNLAPGLVLFATYNNINDENIPTANPSDARYGGAGTTLANFNGSRTRTINVGVAGIRLAF